MKKIDIVHYHLNPGGVTKIIQSQIKSLLIRDTDYDIRLFCGGCPEEEFFQSQGVEVIVDKLFLYADFQEKDPATLNRILRQTEEAARNYFKPDRLIHFHNLNLAKNPYWTLAVHKLALEGYNILNHEHDFAEDREENQLFIERIIGGHFGYNVKNVMYPSLSNYHMAVLNLFDYQRVKRYKFPEERLHYLPNPVNFEEVVPAAADETKNRIYETLGLDKDKKLISYPVRVIRRKNIGEYILLSHFFKEQANFVVTLPPKNPAEVEEYKKWLSFCDGLQLPLVFEAGTKVDFTELITSSDFCVTTSIREGFGMAYIEPWMMNTPVAGRELKNVLQDLTHAGLEFPSLYEKLLVKDESRWRDLAEIGFEKQREIIGKIIESKELTDITFVKNPNLKGLFQDIDRDIIIKNQNIIKEKFSLKSYGERLEKTYGTIDG